MSKGFLRWMFKGAHKSASTYGTLTSVIGVVAVFGGCPQPIPFLLIVGGAVVNLCDALYAYMKYQHLLYRIEQDRIVHGLKQTSNGH